MFEDLVQLIIENRASTATLAGLFFGFASLALGVLVILRKTPQGDSNIEFSVHKFKVSMSSKMPGVMICAFGAFVMYSALQTGKLEIKYGLPALPASDVISEPVDSEKRDQNTEGVLIKTSFAPPRKGPERPCRTAQAPPEQYGFPDRGVLVEGMANIMNYPEEIILRQHAGDRLWTARARRQNELLPRYRGKAFAGGQESDIMHAKGRPENGSERTGLKDDDRPNQADVHLLEPRDRIIPMLAPCEIRPETI